MKHITVCCSANELAEKYTKPAAEFAQLLAKQGYGLVWGGSDTGLMHVVSTTVQKHGGKIVGVSLERFAKVASKVADELIMTSSYAERKGTMLERGDAVVVLAGGIGTLDEITEMLEYKKQNMHRKPIVVLNTDHFYDGFVQQLQRMRADGFIAKSLDELIHFAAEPPDVMTYLNEKLNTIV